MDTHQRLRLFQILMLGLCLLFAETGLAWRGGGAGFHAGGVYHPNVGNHNWGYHPGHGYNNDNYNHGYYNHGYYNHNGYYNGGYYNGSNVWVNPGSTTVIEGSGAYVDPVCQNVQTCSGNGSCTTTQVCN